eukprot:TRINITY_DN3093_c0_g1_i2.p1 TRINITY_DN3093_c0_g1~~TRINITY_DN3093_c0_g1_i2.p1  ORF type:complete len:878 (-),score=221.77 TRINITY_DN3093_c0_g1_i2:22-2379(-)
MRHTCEENDHLDKYGWAQHDGRSFGTQEIIDSQNGLILTTTFVKVNSEKEHGGDWVAKITGRPIKGKESLPISLFYYVASEDTDVNLKLGSKKPSKKGLSPDKIVMSGRTPHLGSFNVIVLDPNETPTLPEPIKPSKSSGDIERTHYFGAKIPAKDAWRLRDHVMPDLQGKSFKIFSDYITTAQAEKQADASSSSSSNQAPIIPTLPNTISSQSNLLVIQRVLKAPFEIEVIFISHSAHPTSDDEDDNDDKEGEGKSASSSTSLSSEALDSLIEDVSGPALDTIIKERKRQFEARFEQTFQLSSKGFSTAEVKFAMYALSNMIGGMGYWHGDTLVQESKKKNNGPVRSSPRSLMSAVPSRPFFPRGFLWDEGFHELLVQFWDPSLSMEVIGHWLNDGMDEKGWIQREQILGDEARSKVPAEFQVQFPNFANPPTLLLAIDTMLARASSSSSSHSKDDESSVPRMVPPPSKEDILPTAAAAAASDEASSPSSSSSSTPSSSSSSGAVVPAYFDSFLEGAYERLQLNFDWYKRTQKGGLPNTFRWRGRTDNHTLTSGLDDYPRGSPPSTTELHVDLLCWMANYADLMSTVAGHLHVDNSDYLTLVHDLRKALEDHHWSEKHLAYCDIGLSRSNGASPELLCHEGYISLFPLLLGVMPPDSPHLPHVLAMIRDPKKIWSDYGLRSLSKSSPYFGKDENYWRGPIWININYLTLRALKRFYIGKAGPYEHLCQETYRLLRSNLVSNMYRVYQETGYIWEQYHPLTGQGQRSHPFTGWSSLIVLIMAELY